MFLTCLAIRVLPEVWGAVGKNIISDRLSTKTALSLRTFSYLCAYIALKHVGGKHSILSEEKLGVLFQ